MYYFCYMRNWYLQRKFTFSEIAFYAVCVQVLNIFNRFFLCQFLTLKISRLLISVIGSWVLTAALNIKT